VNWDVDELRANDFVITKSEDGYSILADGLRDFFRSKPNNKKE
jgi:hypothetical protein